MAKDLVLDVIAKKNSKELSLLADEFDKTAKATDDFGNKLNKTTTFSKYLDEELKNTKLKVKELGEEFDRTGDKDVFGKLKGAQANVKSLERIKKDLATALEDGVVEAGAVIQKRGGLLGLMSKGGKGLAGLFGIGSGSPEAESGLTGIAKAIFTNPVGIAGATGVAAVAGEMIGGAVLTGIGLAGIGAGIALVFKDPRIQPALAAFKHDVGTGLKEAAEPFVVPLQQSLGILDRGFKAELPGIRKMFADIAPEVTGLAHGTAGFLSGLTKGFEDAAVASKPLIQDFSAWLPRFGSEIGSVFSTMGQHAAGAEKGLQTLELGLSGLVVVARDAIPILDGVGKAIDYINIISWEKKFYGIDDTTPRVRGLAGAVVDLTHKDADLAIATGDLDTALQLVGKRATTVDTIAGKMSDTLLGSLLTMDHATLGFQESLTNLGDTLSQNGRAIDKHTGTIAINTKAGEDNREAILSTIAANVRIYDAQIAAGDSAQNAAAKYDVNTQSLRNQLTQAGYTKDQIDGLIGKYAQVPDKVNTDIALKGLTNTLDDLTILLGAINGIPRYVSIEAAITAIDKSGLAQNVAPHDPGRKGNHKAGGGPVKLGQEYVVNEYGVETFTPTQNGYITPAGQSAAPQAVRVEISFAGGALGPLLTEMSRTGKLQISSKAIVN